MSESTLTSPPTTSSRLLALKLALDALLANCDVTADEIAVFVALAKPVNAAGTCFPSQATIAKQLGRSRPWVNERIRRMCDMGLLTKTRQTQAMGGETSCEYHLPCLDVSQSGSPAYTHPMYDDNLTSHMANTSSHNNDTPCHLDDTNLDLHKPIIKEHLSQHESDVFNAIDMLDTYGTQHTITPAITFLPPDWAPTPDDIAWAQSCRPDIVSLGTFTTKFVTKINAAGGTNRAPSIKWREWLTTEYAPTPRSATIKAPNRKPATTTTSDLPGSPICSAAEVFSADETAPNASPVSQTAPTPTSGTHVAVGGGRDSATPLPLAVTTALAAARQWVSQPMFSIPDTTAQHLAEIIRPGLDAIDALFVPTNPSTARIFLETFAKGRGLPLPQADQLAMDVAAIAAIIPADLFPAACRHIWEHFAYRRLPAPPDFTKAIQAQLDQRHNAASQIRTMDKKLKTWTVQASLASRHKRH